MDSIFAATRREYATSSRWITWKVAIEASAFEHVKPRVFDRTRIAGKQRCLHRKRLLSG